MVYWRMTHSNRLLTKYGLAKSGVAAELLRIGVRLPPGSAISHTAGTLHVHFLTGLPLVDVVIARASRAVVSAPSLR